MNELRVEGIRTLAHHLENCRCLTNDTHATKVLNECIAALRRRAATLANLPENAQPDSPQSR